MPCVATDDVGMILGNGPACSAVWANAMQSPVIIMASLMGAD